MKLEEALKLAADRRSAGKPDEAEAIYRQILAQQPNHGQTRMELGVLLHDSGRFADAAAVYRLGLAQDPSPAEMWNNLGNTLCAMGEQDQAISVCRQALAINPGLFAAHTNLANALGGRGDLAGAAKHYRQAIAINGDFADAHNNLGTVLHGQGDLDGAEASIRRALELSPHYAEAHNNLGSVLGDKGQWREAQAEIETAIKLRPDYAAAHWNLSLVLLVQGDLQRGWDEYEWRWRVKGLIVPHLQFTRPRWEGEALNGRRVLLHTEQGLGDAINFVRYAPMVAGRGGETIVYCPPGLVRLLRGVEGVGRVVGWNETLPEFDLHCPLLSLPREFKTTLKNVPNRVPYVSADAELSRRWQERMPKDGRIKVGLTWTGLSNPPGRSIAASLLAPLADLPNVWWCSLQKWGDRMAAEEQERPPLAMVDWTAELNDFADTAALIDNLDLVISIDTSVAHLAGAMGKKTWVFLKTFPDGRWLLERSDSPWYPTIRLFRQREAGDWERPIAEVMEALRTLAGAPPQDFC
jgi:Flp pilus assembly protein TadD